MNKFSLIAVAAGLLMGAASAQTSQVSGYSALIALGKARGIQPPLTVNTLQKLQPDSAAARVIMEKLRVSPSAFAGLLSYGHQAAPAVLATRAVLESATGKTFTDAAVATLIKQNPTLAVTDMASIGALATDPAAIVLANRAAERAGEPVTPRGGGS